jgi:transposase InsO family protein
LVLRDSNLPKNACPFPFKEQAEVFLNHVEDSGLAATIVMHDRDTKFTASFDGLLESAGLEIKLAAHRSPNINAFVERFIQTIQQECLDYFIVFGRQHIRANRSMSLVGRVEGARQAVSINPPLSTSLFACGETERRKRNRSIAKYCSTSWNGRPVSFALA